MEWKLGMPSRTRAMVLAERVAAHPQLQAQLEQLLDEVENRSGGLQLADDAEDVLVERMRTMTQQALSDWAAHRQQQLQPGPAAGTGRDVKKTAVVDDAGLD